VVENGEGVVVVDAGGGTVDVSAYARKSTSARGELESFGEVAVPHCHFRGAVFVSIEARKHLQEFLSESDFLEDLDHIVNCFDKSTKERFSSDIDPQYIKFGGMRDKDEACNIRFGQLKLSGADVACFFAPSVRCIVDAVLEQIKSGHHTIKHVVLVGGFSASDWLFTKVGEALAPKGLNVIRPDNHVSKAVSDGALSNYLGYKVETRVSKFAYGTRIGILYDANSPEHVRRHADLFTTASNERRVDGRFQVLLPKNTRVSTSKEFKTSLGREFLSKKSMERVTTPVWCYKGSITDPKWMDTDADNYSHLCTIEMDLSHLPIVPQARKDGKSGNFWDVYWDLILTFSTVELKASIEWLENGAAKRSPAKTVFEPNDA